MDIKVKPLRPNFYKSIPENAIGIEVLKDLIKDFDLHIDKMESYISNLEKDMKRDEELIAISNHKLITLQKNYAACRSAWKMLQSKIARLPDIDFYIEQWKQK